jgi:hypothetical protein
MEANSSWINVKYVVDLIKNRGVAGSFTPWKGNDPKGEGRYGVWTDASAKVAYDIHLREALPHLAFAREYAPGLARVDAGRRRLCEQLGHFRKITELTDDGKQKITWTGKGPGRRDDMVLSLQIALHYMYTLIREDKQFETRCREEGLMCY